MSAELTGRAVRPTRMKCKYCDFTENHPIHKLQMGVMRKWKGTIHHTFRVKEDPPPAPAFVVNTPRGPLPGLLGGAVAVAEPEVDTDTNREDTDTNRDHLTGHLGDVEV